MRYFKVNVKFGHVGKNNYYNGYLYVSAENKKVAANIARQYPRVKHDHWDAILGVEELDYETFKSEESKNKELCYFSCYNIQQQREHFVEIEENVFREEWADVDHRSYKKRNSLRKTYNVDPDYEKYKYKRNIDFVA